MTRPGYAFPMALAAVIVIALVTAVAAQQVRSSSNALITLSDAAARERAAFSGEQAFVFAMLTEPMTVEGLMYGGEQVNPGLLALGAGPAASSEGTLFRADGSAYLAPSAADGGELVVRLFDNETFFNVAGGTERDIEQTLLSLGVERARVGGLAAKHVDFRDEDDQRRLGGGEAPSYDDPSLPPNRRLRDPLEICMIAEWRDAGLCEDRSRLLLLATARANNVLNMRVASRPLLQTLIEDEDEVRETLERIRNGRITRFEDIGLPGFDTASDGLSVATPAGPDLVLFTHPRSGVPARRTALRLTPQDLTSPYEVMNTYIVGGEAAARFLRVPENAELIGLPDAGEDAGARERR